MTQAMTTTTRDRTHRTTPMWRVWTRLASVFALALFVATDPSIGQEQSAPAPQAPTAVAASAQIDNLVVITIEGAIDAVTSKSFERRFNQAIEGGADGIVVEIDSPGGEVGAVLEITDLIKSASVPTIAWINNDAYSGGAIIAIACDEIVLATGSTMGDAAPVMAGPMGLQNLSETERAKILSPLLAEVVDSAAMNGYDEVLITSLVMVNVETWLVEHKQTGKRYFLTEREYRALFNEEPPRATPLVQSGGVDLSTLAPPPTATGPSRFPDSAIPTSPNAPDTGNQPAPTTLPDDAPPILEALSDVADESTIAAASIAIATPSSRPDFAKESADDYDFIQYATDGNTLLTLKESGLRALGFTRYPNTIDNDQELEQYVGAKNLVRLDQSWSEDFVAFATQGMSGLLFRGAMIVIFLLGLFVEMAMPGVGVAGFIALIALAGLIVPPMMIDASSWWTLVAILGGILLIMLEIFVIPGLGIPGILGLLALLAGLIGTFSGAGELFPGTGPGNDGRLGWAVATVFLALFGAGVGCYFVSKYSRSIPIARNLMLSTTLATYDTSEPTGMLAAMGTATADHPVDIGDEGVATTDIRPEGEAEFAGELHDVFTPSGWIGRNARVVVSGFEGSKILVEKLDADPPAAPKTPHENYGSYG